jgi:dienelactone hydrolase/lysophospholipase L1-like esterase
MRFPGTAGVFLALVLLPALAQAQDKTDLPRVVLLGDSIRQGYAPLVAKKLAGQAVIVSPPGVGDSAWLLANLEKFALTEKPALVHFNAGLHDLKLGRAGKTHQVEIAVYKKNLEEIVARLRKGSSASIVFANTTPIHDERHAKRKAAFDRFEADVARYNAAAEGLMRSLGVAVNDLHTIVERGGVGKLLGGDGTHYTAEGNEVLATAVADCVLRQLAIRQGFPKAPAPDPKATENYRKAEAERDAQVPEVYRKIRVGTFAVPLEASEWKERRPGGLKTVVGSLGDLPERPAKPSARLVCRELRPGYVLEGLAIPNGIDGEITANLLLPEGTGKAPRPAVLWLHSSSANRNRLLIPGAEGGEEPLGEVLVKAGYVVLAPDAAWYGGRSGAGPAGPSETAARQQESLFKLNLWLGRTLWGMFVRDDQVALDYLCSRPEVDPKRIGATGMSMGSTRSWWLAAVDERVRCAAGVACLTRYQNLIAHGQLRQHGVYYFANGLLRHFDSEGVVALIAPRPFLAVTGELDAGSPADGIKVIEEKVEGVYAALGAKERFRSVRYPGVGHIYTPAMRKEVLAWFDRWLEPGRKGE